VPVFARAVPAKVEDVLQRQLTSEVALGPQYTNPTPVVAEVCIEPRVKYTRFALGKAGMIGTHAPAGASNGLARVSAYNAEQSDNRKTV
jgi:hypothetical protein